MWAQTPDVAWATAQQETFPAWSARQQSAEQRGADRAAWFAGKKSFDEAFPYLIGAALDDGAVLRGRLSLLQQAAVDRAAERLEPVPALGSEAREKKWRDNRDAALASEEAAEVPERRLLVESAALLLRFPQLEAGVIDREKAVWRRQIAAAAALATDDPQREAADRRAASADEAMRRLDAVVPEVRAILLRPGIGSLDPSEDLARLEKDGLGAAIRLETMAPALGPARGVLVEETLVAWWTEAGKNLDPPAVFAPDIGLGALEARVSELAEIQAEREDAVNAAVVSGMPSGEAKFAALKAWNAAATADVEAGMVLLEEARGRASSAAELIRLKQEAASNAAEEAAAALANASDARERKGAEFLKLRADSQDRALELAEFVEEAIAASEEMQEAVELEIGAIEDAIAAIEDPTPGQPAPEPDAQYQALRAFSSEHRTGDIARGTKLVAEKRRYRTIGETIDADRALVAEGRVFSASIEVEDEALIAAIDAWEAGLDAELENAGRLVDQATSDRDVVLKGLHRARESRRKVGYWVSAAEATSDARFAVQDAIDELALFGPSVVMQLRDRFNALLGLPFLLLDFNVLTGLVSGSFWIILALAGWFWAHSQASDWALRAANRVRRMRPELRPTDLKALRDPVARFLRNFVDLLVGGIIVGPLSNIVSELGFLVLVYLQFSLYRVLLAAFDLAVVPADEVRPAVAVVRREVWELARLTVRVVLGYFIARYFVHYLLWDVFRFDVIDSAILSVFTLVALGGVCWALYMWHPFLRARISRRDQESRAIAFLSREEEHWLVRVPRALAIVAFFGAILVVDLGALVIKEGSSAARVANAVNRYRLQRDDETPRRRLPQAAVDAIVDHRTPQKQVLQRPEVTPVVADAVAHWRSAGRGGLLALVGGRGSGKKTACEAVEIQLKEAGLELVTAVLRERLVEDTEMIAWLCTLFGLGPHGSAEDVVESLEQLKPRAIVLQGIHRAYCRRVGGFEAISTLFYVSNATSHRHFWIISMHQPTWEFLASMGSLVDRSVFKTEVALAPMDAHQLRTLTTARTRRAGWEADFSDLTSSNPLGGDPAIELERAVNLFYRLLIEASEGNPTVALHLWTQCLEPQDDGKTAKVYLSSALRVGVIDDLVDHALFALVALHIQDELDEGELIEVTNLSSNAVRHIVRDLVMRGLVAHINDRYMIVHKYVPLVARTLRRRHILHLGVS